MVSKRVQDHAQRYIWYYLYWLHEDEILVFIETKNEESEGWDFQCKILLGSLLEIFPQILVSLPLFTQNMFSFLCTSPSPTLDYGKGPL